MVKSTKRCLKKVLGKARLTYEELSTVLVEVECVLNSRPLTYLYPEDLEEPLTPSHLISGQRLLSLPGPSTPPSTNPTSTKETVTKRAKYLIQLLDRFWNRWRCEYVTSLRESHRLKKENVRQPIQVGDLVCIHDENHPRTLWKTGIVKELIEGSDHKIRGAVVRASENGKISILRRPLQRLCPMELKDDKDAAEADYAKVSTVDDSKDIMQPKAQDQPNLPIKTRPRRKAAEDGEQKRRLLTNT